MFGLTKKILIGLLTGLVNGSKNIKCVSLSYQKCIINPLLLIYILMNIVKNFTTIHLRLN